MYTFISTPLTIYNTELGNQSRFPFINYAWPEEYYQDWLGYILSSLLIERNYSSNQWALVPSIKGKFYVDKTMVKWSPYKWTS